MSDYHDITGSPRPGASVEIERLTAEVARVTAIADGRRCPQCDTLRLEAGELRAELNEAADATGIAGVDNQMSLVECVRSLRDENEALRAKVQGVIWYIDRTLKGDE